MVDGNLTLTFGGVTHDLAPGGYAYLAPGADWSIRNTSQAEVRFHWIRKAYQALDGLDMPESFVTNERGIDPIPMPDTGGAWATTRFVAPEDLRHDMHVNIVTFQTGGVIPFAETHVIGSNARFSPIHASCSIGCSGLFADLGGGAALPLPRLNRHSLIGPFPPLANGSRCCSRSPLCGHWL